MTAMPATPMAPVNVAGPMSMVQLRNIGPVDFVKEYHVDTIRIPAGQSMIVMWDIMVYWLGNPSLVDESIRQKDRTKEVNRLRVLYGAYEDENIWNACRPQLEAYALTGERIWTVAEDPNGEHVTPATQSQAYAATYEAQIAVMQKQIDALQAMMSQEAVVTPALAETPVAPTPVDGIARVTGATVPAPPMPSTPLTAPPMSPPPSAPPFNPQGSTQQIGPSQTMPINPADNRGEWVDTTPKSPPNMPPFKVGNDGPPEDVATGPRVA